ncbi:MAG: M48 family metalloprotease [Acidimicrobiales bacterium]
MTVLLIAAAAWLFVEATRVPVIGVLGLLCLALAYAVRPRLGRIPKKAVVLTRESHPRTFELLDRLGHDVGGPAFDRVALTRDINAGTSRVGVRRTRVLYLGVPLWNCMDWNERTGLLGHELGHQVNGDVRRGFFLATSIQALRTWIDILTPRSRLHSSIQIVFRTVVRYPLRWVARGLLASQLRLSSGRSRMGEYRADDIAAGLAGTEAVIRGLDTTLIASDCLSRSVRMCLYQPEADLRSEEKRFVADFPRRQRMRLRRINQLSATSLYSTHPSVHCRMVYVAAQPTSLAGSAPGASLWAGVDAELAPLIQRIGAQICEQNPHARHGGDVHWHLDATSGPVRFNPSA